MMLESQSLAPARGFKWARNAGRIHTHTKTWPLPVVGRKIESWTCALSHSAKRLLRLKVVACPAPKHFDNACGRRPASSQRDAPAVSFYPTASIRKRSADPLLPRALSMGRYPRFN